MRQNYDVTQYEAAAKKRTRLTAAIIFLGIPVLIALGVVLFRDRSYMLISMLLLFFTMLPFFMVFERRRPKARELVMIAVMVAITVVLHLMFGLLLSAAVGSALVIIAGIGMGPEAGFLVGALSRFVCNFYQGQGPWTPWQMFCWGILGFLAGLTFNKMEIDQKKTNHFKVVMGPLVCIVAAFLAAYVSFLIWHEDGETFFGWRLYVFGAVGLLVGLLVQRKRLPIDDVTLVLYTFLSIFIIYGGIMNICAWVTSSMEPGRETEFADSIRLLYISGVPYDAFHALGASVFMFLFGEKMIRKIERIKIKYGIYR